MIQILINNTRGTHSGVQVDPIASIHCDVDVQGLELTVKAPNGETLFSNESAPIPIEGVDLTNGLTAEQVPAFLARVANALNQSAA